jgi:uncharacterized protein
VEIFAIPVRDKYILYRPLLRRAFVGNRAMVDVVLALSDPFASEVSRSGEAMSFLEAAGFLQADPAPPLPPNHSCQPTSAVLLLTSRCNLRCTYCYASGGETPIQDVSPALARTVIDHVLQNAKNQGQASFELSFHGGGEPVQAWETVQKATAYARNKELPCNISMVSNGVWTARQREWILHNLNNVNISFDGRQETQDRQRPFASGQGSFRAVLRTIEALDKAEFRYAIRMTATAPWQAQLPRDVRFICEETGCPAIQVEPAFNTRRGEHSGPTQEEGMAFAEAFMEAFEIAHKSGRHLHYSGSRPWLVTHTFCGAPYGGALAVNPAETLVACYEVTNDRHPLADMFTVGRIVDSKVKVDRQAQIALWTHLKEKRALCRGCFCYWHCAGDCYPRAFAAAGGRFDALNPRCRMNREITARMLLWYIREGNGLWQGQGAHPLEAQLERAF